jgi:hypothetical protein
MAIFRRDSLDSNLTRLLKGLIKYHIINSIFLHSPPGIVDLFQEIIFSSNRHFFGNNGKLNNS